MIIKFYLTIKNDYTIAIGLRMMPHSFFFDNFMSGEKRPCLVVRSFEFTRLYVCVLYIRQTRKRQNIEYKRIFIANLIPIGSHLHKRLIHDSGALVNVNVNRCN